MDSLTVNVNTPGAAEIVRCAIRQLKKDLAAKKKAKALTPEQTAAKRRDIAEAEVFAFQCEDAAKATA